ncbi:MAG: hypothetical protein AABX72_02955, partial [Nanoarchaeota archaeon]
RRVIRYVIATFDMNLIRALSSVHSREDGEFFGSYSENAIGSFVPVPNGTNKIYYKQLTLKMPEWANKMDIARKIAKASDLESVQDLELTPTDIFTPDSEEAMDFDATQGRIQADHFSQKYHIKFVLEEVLRGDYPF